MRRDGSFQKIVYRDNTFYLVKMLVDEMNKQQISQNDMCRKVGIDRTMITKWKTKQRPTIDLLRACFNVLGYDITIKRIRDEASS